MSQDRIDARKELVRLARNIARVTRPGDLHAVLALLRPIEVALLSAREIDAIVAIHAVEPARPRRRRSPPASHAVSS